MLPDASPGALALLKELLAYNPNKRPGAERVLAECAYFFEVMPVTSTLVPIASTTRPVVFALGPVAYMASAIAPSELCLTEGNHLGMFDPLQDPLPALPSDIPVPPPKSTAGGPPSADPPCRIPSDSNSVRPFRSVRSARIPIGQRSCPSVLVRTGHLDSAVTFLCAFIWGG